MTTRRTILVLALLVGCFVLIGTDRALLGWSFLLVALLLIGWEAFEVVLSLLELLIVIGFVCAIVWLPFGFFGQVTVKDWLIDYWYSPAFWFVGGIFGIWQTYRSRDETWVSLKAGFDEDCARGHAPDEYPIQSGVLTFLEDSLFVSVIATEVGLIIVKSEEEAIHIPWKRIKVISHLGLAHRQLATYSLQTKSLPKRVQAPWNDDFAEWIPPTVKHVDA